MTAPQASPSPRVARASTQLLVLTPIRLGLGLAGLAAAALLERPAVAAIAFALGVLGSAVALGADPRYSRDRLGDVQLLPAGARFATRREIAARGLFPSTIGVTVLTAVALFFNATLAALLAGLLAGMALAGFIAWLNLDTIERRLDYRLYLEHGGRKGVFSGPR